MSYKIIRIYQNPDKASRTIKRRLSLEQAREHCTDPETSSSTAKGAKARAITLRNGPWFDAYIEAH